MVQNLAPFKQDLIRGIMLHQKLTTRKMTDAAGCSERSIKVMCSNLHYFGSTKTPQNGGGKHPSITLHMLEVLHEGLLEKPELYLEELAVDILMSPSTVTCKIGFHYMQP